MPSPIFLPKPPVVFPPWTPPPIPVKSPVSTMMSPFPTAFPIIPIPTPVTPFLFVPFLVVVTFLFFYFTLLYFRTDAPAFMFNFRFRRVAFHVRIAVWGTWTAIALVRVTFLPLSIIEINTLISLQLMDINGFSNLFLSFIAISRSSSSLVCCSCFSRSVLIFSAILSALTKNMSCITTVLIKSWVCVLHCLLSKACRFRLSRSCIVIEVVGFWKFVTLSTCVPPAFKR